MTFGTAQLKLWLLQISKKIDRCTEYKNKKFIALNMEWSNAISQIFYLFAI